MKNSDLFRNENDYADFPGDAAVAHLAQTLRFPTVSHVDTSATDYTAFDRMQTFLRTAYPQISAKGTWEKIGHSLLITLPGSDPDLAPALFMAHQDVVPIVPGTEGDWRHDPFSGDVAEGFIWGRGAMDIKEMLVAEMESAEYLLARGVTFRRTVYLAFGEDEETCSTGAMAIVQTLRERGVRLEFVLDEGAGDVTDAADWGAPGTLICTIGMYEKGYGDLRLRAKSAGGHSSNPYHGTSLGHLAEAISAILHHPPRARLSESVRNSLAILRPWMTEEPMRSWALHPESFEKEILEWFQRRESLYHLVQTTIAPTMIQGGSPAGNVMPQDMEAVINFRMIPEDPPDRLLTEYRKLLSEDISIEWAQQIAASVPSQIDSYGYRSLKSVLEHYFDRLVFIPAQNKGATDARQYEPLCRCVMRFGPFLEEEAISAEGIHGTNERISIWTYLQGIRVLIRLMEETCLRGKEANE
ncbi:MAG: M20/M25/M40 family metallo-hydrolase [Clostridia bacterium]|nr:M20/M25/M40 family metallo-hydrolase [Clostridia bacterium]